MPKSGKYVLLGSNAKECVVTDETFEKAVEYFRSYHESRRLIGMKRGSCFSGTTIKSIYRRRGAMRPRQLPDIGHALRKAILKQNWNEAAYLAHFINLAGVALYESTVIRTCFYLLFNHPNSTPELLEEFVKKCTNYVLPEEVRKFIKILFAIRKEPLPITGVGKFIRKSVKYKIVDDMYFNDL